MPHLIPAQYHTCTDNKILNSQDHHKEFLYNLEQEKNPSSLQRHIFICIDQLCVEVGSPYVHVFIKPSSSLLLLFGQQGRMIHILSHNSKGSAHSFITVRCIHKS